MAGTVRLDRALSKLGIWSRSDARRHIAAGEVRVRGRIVRDPAVLVIPETAAIEIIGKKGRTVQWRTVALNKPRGVITTRRDPEGRRTVFDVLGDEGASLVAVGRLDQASTGLLLLTTDTQLANWLTSPESGVVRRYVVTARGFVADESAQRMEAGIGGLRARSVVVRKRSKRETHLVIELTEGRNREIWRLLQRSPDCCAWHSEESSSARSNRGSGGRSRAQRWMRPFQGMRDHSVLSASSGSIRVARRAGTNPASKATVRSSMTADTSVAGSVGVRPKSWDSMFH